ncbi:MAG: O-antigen ligase family protein [Nitrosomonadales bacterium]|nr:O-antigen ligase family protein [Nitrosomonadales bacterium]
MMLTAAANPLQRFAMPPLRASTVLIGFAVPVSVALDNVLLALVLTGLLFNARAVLAIAAQHPVARAAWLLFGMLLLAMFYGATPLREAAGILWKYADLAFIPLFMLMLSSETAKRRAQYAFLAAMGITLLLSYLVGLGILPVQHWMNTFATADNPVIFHSHITQNNMMAFAVFISLLNLRDATYRWAQVVWGLFALLGAINILFMVQGRTGYVILMALLCWFAWITPIRYMRLRGKRWDWRLAVAAELALLALMVAIYSVSPRMQNRVNLAVSESQTWQTKQAKDTSTGQRLLFYDHTLQIVKQQPVLGVGTGGFHDAFAKQTQGKDVPATHNPHNEYLMITVQTGVIGLVFLLYLFYAQWRYAPLLYTPFEQDAARGFVLAYIVNCALNSALLDHSDGLFFAFMTSVLFAGLKLEKKNG